MTYVNNVQGLLLPDITLVPAGGFVRNAGEAGFSHVMRLPAPSGFFAYGANMLSEIVLNLNDLTKSK